MVLSGLDGTTESLYSQLRIEQEAMKNGMETKLKIYFRKQRSSW
jgi:hypothetical protein